MFYDNSTLAFLIGSYVFALTSGDVALLIAALIGSSGIGGLASLWLGLRKMQSDARRRELEAAAEIKTVAAAEADMAMKIMGGSVVRLEAEVVAALARVKRCEDAWLEHIKICPLWKDSRDRKSS